MSEDKSQVELLLDHLKENGSITGIECIVELGILNYKGRIADLRALGYRIKTVMETRVNAKGKKKRYARYVLESEVPA